MIRVLISYWERQTTWTDHEFYQKNENHKKRLSGSVRNYSSKDEECLWWAHNRFNRAQGKKISKLEDVSIEITKLKHQFSSVQLLSRVQLFATPWIAARQASLSITNSRSSLRFTSIKSVMPSSHLILCHPLLLLPPIPPSIKVFSNRETNNNKNKNRESKHLIGMLEREKRIRQKKYLKR